MKNIFFVDSENVGDSWIELFEYLHDEDIILVFYTDKSPNMSYSNVIIFKQSPVEPEFILCENGTDNSLDFQLVTYLGSFTTKNPDDNLIIVSKDKGFDSVVHFWSKRGYKVSRKSPSIFHTLSDETPVDIPIIDSTIEISENQVFSESTQEPKYNTEQVNTLLSCTGKSNLSAIHNILISIYGQPTGSQIYNIIKNPAYEVPVVNWQKKTKYRKFLNIVYSNAGIMLSDDFFKKLYTSKANLREIHNLFVNKYGQEKGTEYYRIYKNHSEYLQKTF